MNMEYLEEFYNSNKEKLLDSECEIESFEELIDYIETTISSNIEYDFNLSIDMDQLLNLKENVNEM